MLACACPCPVHTYLQRAIREQIKGFFQFAFSLIITFHSLRFFAFSIRFWADGISQCRRCHGMSIIIIIIIFWPIFFPLYALLKTQTELKISLCLRPTWLAAKYPMPAARFHFAEMEIYFRALALLFGRIRYSKHFESFSWLLRTPRNPKKKNYMGNGMKRTNKKRKNSHCLGIYIEFFSFVQANNSQCVCELWKLVKSWSLHLIHVQRHEQCVVTSVYTFSLTKTTRRRQTQFAGMAQNKFK